MTDNVDWKIFETLLLFFFRAIMNFSNFHETLWLGMISLVSLMLIQTVTSATIAPQSSQNQERTIIRISDSTDPTYYVLFATVPDQRNARYAIYQPWLDEALGWDSRYIVIKFPDGKYYLYGAYAKDDVQSTFCQENTSEPQNCLQFQKRKGQSTLSLAPANAHPINPSSPLKVTLAGKLTSPKAPMKSQTMANGVAEWSRDQSSMQDLNYASKQVGTLLQHERGGLFVLFANAKVRVRLDSDKGKEITRIYPLYASFSTSAFPWGERLLVKSPQNTYDFYEARSLNLQEKTYCRNDCFTFGMWNKGQTMVDASTVTSNGKPSAIVIKKVLDPFERSWNADQVKMVGRIYPWVIDSLMVNIYANS